MRDSQVIVLVAIVERVLRYQIYYTPILAPVSNAMNKEKIKIRLRSPVLQL